MLSIFLVCIVFSLSCQQQPSTTFERSDEKLQVERSGETLQVEEIPADWQKIETEKFSFSIPPTMKNKNVQGIDSFIMEFGDSDLTLVIESGVYTPNAVSQLQKYEGRKEPITVDGENVELVSYDLNKPRGPSKKTVNADGSSESKKPEKNHVFSIYIPHKNEVVSVGNGAATSFEVMGQTLETGKIAKTIFHSIKFKQK